MSQVTQPVRSALSNLLSSSQVGAEGIEVARGTVIFILPGSENAVRLAEPEVLPAKAKVDNLLRSPVARHPDVLLEAKRPEKLEVEGERALDVPDAEIARMLRCRPVTVRSHIRRGITSLREVLT